MARLSCANIFPPKLKAGSISAADPTRKAVNISFHSLVQFSALSQSFGHILSNSIGIRRIIRESFFHKSSKALFSCSVRQATWLFWIFITPLVNAADLSDPD